MGNIGLFWRGGSSSSATIAAKLFDTSHLLRGYSYSGVCAHYMVYNSDFALFIFCSFADSGIVKQHVSERIHPLYGIPSQLLQHFPETYWATE